MSNTNVTLSNVVGSYEVAKLQRQNIIFRASDNTEMICIAPDGFWVRGVKLEQDETEARKLFDALMEFMWGRGK